MSSSRYRAKDLLDSCEDEQEQLDALEEVFDEINSVREYVARQLEYIDAEEVKGNEIRAEEIRDILESVIYDLEVLQEV